jgi:hypothetical protein
MSGVILRSRALERPDGKKRTSRKFNKQPRVSKRRKWQSITEIKNQLQKLNTTDFILTDTGAGDKEANRYDQLLKVHEQHLDKLKDLKEKCLALEKENESINEGSVHSLDSTREREQELRSLLNFEQRKIRDLESCSRRKANEFQEELKRSESEKRKEKESSDRLSKQLAEEKIRRERLESELNDVEKQLEDYAKDPDSYDVTDLGEMYADIFEVNAEEINQYDVRRGKKTVTGVACWFEMSVMDVLSELNRKFLGLLEDDVNWFINFLFKHDLAHNFCLYLGQYNEYRKNQLKQMTRFNRNAFERAISNERLKLISLIAFALRTEKRVE